MGPSTDQPSETGPESNRENRLEDGSRTDPKLTEQINAQVTTLETESLTIQNSEVQARVRHLIKLIKTSLQSRTLNRKTQKELARLLSLTPTLDGRHAQQLNLLDLAVSILLEPNGSATGAGRAENELDAESASDKNLIFVQETRRQIAQQSRAYPDLFRAIFITGGGTPYIRLISGLSWFFFLFVMTPLTVAGLTFAGRDIAGFIEAKDKIEDLQSSQQQLLEENARQQAQIETLTRRRDALAAQLGRTSSQIAAIAPETPSNSNAAPADSTVPNNAAGAPANQPANQPTNEATPGTPAAPTDTRSTVESITVTRQTLNTIQTEIESELRSNVNRSEPANGFSEGNTPTPQANRAPGDRTADNRTETSTEALADDRIFTTSFSLILLAVAMGALGSTISVIVRATTFIRQAQENDNDLFLTGFFRPFVGMSFAIFCVALVEAGIFSGIFDLTNRKDTDRTYFYVAIAFVAGFSERLVRDVVLKTEDTIAGPNGNNNRWR